jgi:hypothetical protein
MQSQKGRVKAERYIPTGSKSPLETTAVSFLSVIFRGNDLRTASAAIAKNSSPKPTDL